MNTDIQFAIVPKWLLDSDASDRAVSLYARLAATFGDSEDSEAFAGIEGMARVCGKDERWVRRGLKELAEVGAITRTRRVGTSTLTTIHRLPVHLRTNCASIYGRTESSVSDPQSIPSVNQTKLLTKSIPHLETKEHLEEHFNHFYQQYPRRVGKGAARRAFIAATKKASPEKIEAGLAAAKAAWKDARTEQEFIPHPATWLNGERWADDLGSPATDEQDLDRLHKAQQSIPTEAEREALRAANQFPFDEETRRKLGQAR